MPFLGRSQQALSVAPLKLGCRHVTQAPPARCMILDFELEAGLKVSFWQGRWLIYPLSKTAVVKVPGCPAFCELLLGFTVEPFCGEIWAAPGPGSLALQETPWAAL